MYKMLLKVFFLLMACSICSGADPILGLQNCGKINSCFKWPPMCTSLNNCNIYVTYLYNKASQQLSVNLHGRTNGWAAFGLNERDRIMGGSVGEICMMQTSKVTLQGFITEGTELNMMELPKSVKPVRLRFDKGWLVCSYTRPVKDGYLKNLNQSWFLISSWGKTRGEMGGKPREHETGDYFWSKNKVDLREKLNVPVKTFGWDLIAVHGSLMILAWIGFATSAIFYARYMKEVWQNTIFREKPLWLQLHRSFMLGSTFLVVLSFVVILVEVKGWNTEMGAHPALGIVVVILVCLQTISGIVRPSIGSSKRTFFQYGHTFFGIIGFLLATITMFLGLGAVEVDLVVMIVFFTVLAIVVVGIEARKFYKSRTVSEVHYREEDFQQTEMESEEPVGGLDSKEIFVRKAITLLVSCTAFAMALLMIALLALKANTYLSKGKVSS